MTSAIFCCNRPKTGRLGAPPGETHPGAPLSDDRRALGSAVNIAMPGTIGGWPVQNPHYDFRDEALPIGASLIRAPGGEETGAIWRS
jgi:hypothetical protein